MTSESYVVASADSDAPPPNVRYLPLAEAAVGASGGLLAGGATSCRAKVVGIRFLGGGI